MNEHFYNGVVSVFTKFDAAIIDFEELNFEEFTRTTSGGTLVGAIIFDMGNAERFINGTKSLIRSKKKQLVNSSKQCIILGWRKVMSLYA